MRKLIAALLFSLGLASAALAQTTFTMPPPAGVTVVGVQVVTTCGAASLTNNAIAFLAMDITGTLCTKGATGTTIVAGNVSNASSGVAISSTNVPTVNYNYVWNGTTWDQAAGLVVGTAGVPSTQVVSVQGVTSGTPITTQGASTGGGFPTAATAITISATGTTGATAAALPAASSKTTYVCGFSITSDAVAGLSGNATVAGVITGTMTYIQGVGVAPAVASTTQNFNPCIPSSTTNTAITITSAAAGTGGTTAVNAWGYQQ